MLLILTGGATVTPEDDRPNLFDDEMGRYKDKILWRPKRFLRRPPIYLPNNEVDPVVPVPPTDCKLPTTDYFLNPFGMSYPLRRPQGSGRTFYPSTHAWTQAFNTRNGIVLNRSTSGYGGPLFDATMDSTVRTVAREGGGTGNGLPATAPIPNSFGNIGPPGTDLSFDVYDGTNEIWHDFYAYNRTANTAKAHYAYSGKQGTSSPRGSCASGILFPITVVRAIDWNVGCLCQHAIGIAIQGFGTDSDLLADIQNWPAIAKDNVSYLNKGKIPYGAWLALPTPAEGGPSLATLNPGVGDTMRLRAIIQAWYYGWVVVDQGANVVMRADQTMSESLNTQFIDAINNIYRHMRFVSNVGASGSNPIGGGTPLASNCGYDRVTPDIKTVQGWEGAYDFDQDYKDVVTNDKNPGTNVTRGWDDSWKHYEKAYSFGGNAKMWQATDDTRYLERVLTYTEAIIDAARISSSLGSAGFGDSYLGWLGKTHPANAVQEAPLYEFYCWRWIAALLMEAYRRNMMSSGTYSTRLQNIQEFLETHVWGKWIARGVNSYIYRTVAWISSHAAIIALLLRTKGSTSTIRSQAATIQDNIDHIGQPNYGGPYNNIRSMLIPHPWGPSNTYFSDGYFQSPPPPNTVPASYQRGNPNESGADTSHFEAVCVYIDECIKQGYGTWNMTDITKLINLWTLVWPNSTTHYNWLRGPTAPTSPLTWAPNYNEFSVIAGYDRNIQKRFEGVTNARQALYYGSGAYNSRRLGAP